MLHIFDERLTMLKTELGLGLVGEEFSIFRGVRFLKPRDYFHTHHQNLIAYFPGPLLASKLSGANCVDEAPLVGDSPTEMIPDVCR